VSLGGAASSARALVLLLQDSRRVPAAALAGVSGPRATSVPRTLRKPPGPLQSPWSARWPRVRMQRAVAATAAAAALAAAARARPAAAAAAAAAPGLGEVRVPAGLGPGGGSPGAAGAAGVSPAPSASLLLSARGAEAALAGPCGLQGWRGGVRPVTLGSPFLAMPHLRGVAEMEVTDRPFFELELELKMGVREQFIFALLIWGT
jgi:hypothetical protein